MSKSPPDRRSAAKALALVFVFALFASVLFAPRVVAQVQSTVKVQGDGSVPTKGIPQAKSREEFSDYNAAYAIAGGAALEQAADDFAAKYPASELRSYLYSKAMREYENEDNAPKMLSTGRQVLVLDPDSIVALVLTAEVLADSLSDIDQDRAQKIAEIKRNARHALQLIDSGAFPAEATPATTEMYKTTLPALARSALGIMELKSGDNEGAENDLRIATTLGEAEPDPYDWYHLALAQDHLKKYAEARASADQALRYASDAPDLSALIEAERQRLARLAK
jgi:tetratricopeptide (TPR) repeat protein